MVWKASASPFGASVLPSFSERLCPSVGIPPEAIFIIVAIDGRPPAPTMPAIASMPPPVVAPIQ